MRINSHQVTKSPASPAGGQSHKQRLFLSAVFCVSFIFCAGCAKQGIKNIDSKGKTIVCYGDSITYGYGAEPGEDYPTALAKMVTRPVINAGIDGDTTIEALKRIKADVIDRDPYLVVIEFSGNDFLRKIPPEVTLANVKIMIDRIQQGGAMVALVDISAGPFLRDYRGAYCNLAKEKRAIFIPSLLNGIITNPSFKSDFIHPNKEGYQLIAQRIYRVILPYLNCKNKPQK